MLRFLYKGRVVGFCCVKCAVYACVCAERDADCPVFVKENWRLMKEVGREKILL